MYGFLGQGFSEDNKSVASIVDSEDIDSIGAALEATISDNSFTKATVVVAFATAAGVDHLTQMTSDGNLKSCTVHVGVDENVTSRDALESIHNSTLNGHVYHGQTTFHPKLFYFEGPDRIRAIVGSGNLTQDGLFSNYEAALLLDGPKDEPSLQAAVEDFESYIESIRTHGNQLSESLIAELANDGMVMTESAQREQRAASSESDSSPMKAC